MRYLGVLLIISLLGITYGDEIVKKDGSVLKGKIIEKVPGEYYKIKMQDGSIFVIKEKDIETVKYSEKEEWPVVSGQSPCLAGGLSFLVPGLGQVYNEEYKKAGLFFVGWLITSVIAYSNIFEEDDPIRDIAKTGYFAIALWSAIDAYHTAQKINRARGYGAIFNFENGRLALGMPMVKINDDRKGNYQLEVVNMQF